MPIGRRLAFDAAKGRFWVVCKGCGRWNLVPMEERWEAIEACERKFRATKVRLSTDQIGLARLASDVDLVRVGNPVLPEFAAWRYGSELWRRHRSSLPRKAVRVLGVPALVLAAPVVGAVFGTMGGVAYAGAMAFAAYRRRTRPALSIVLSHGDRLDLSREQVEAAELIRAEDEADQWAMWIGCDPGAMIPRGWKLEATAAGEKRALLTGTDGRIAAARVLPRLNPLGGNPEAVQSAVKWLEAAGGPGRALHTFARSKWVRPALDTIERTLITLHPDARLGLEMALHEDEERRALYGELTILKWAWQREESIAAIVDEIDG